MVRKFHKSVEEAKKELENIPSHFARGFLNGLGWTFGATLGFAIIVSIGAFVLAQLGTLPVIGDFFSDLRESLNQIARMRENLPR